MIYDLSYHQCTDLHLHNISQMGGVNDRIFPAVFFVDGKMLPGDGIYCVKDTWDPVIFGLASGSGIGIPMVITDGETQDQGISSLITCCQSFAVQQGRNGIFCIFYSQDLILRYLIGAGIAVTGTDEIRAAAGDQSRSLFYLSREKVIVTAVACLFIIAHVDGIGSDERLDQTAGDSGI